MASPSAPVQPATWLRAVVPLAAVVLVVVAVAFPRRSDVPAAAGAGAQPERRDAAVDVTPSTPQIVPAPAPIAARAEESIVVTTRANEPPRKLPAKPVASRVTGTAKSVATVAAATPVADPPKHDEPAPAPAAPATPTPVAATSTADAATVTITGCLEVSTDGDTFRLNDIVGADAPKARSWRSGFFKKRPAPVVLVGSPDPQALTANVGHRVAVTGQLASRELHVSALRVVGSSCN